MANKSNLVTSKFQKTCLPQIKYSWISYYFQVQPAPLFVHVCFTLSLSSIVGGKINLLSYKPEFFLGGAGGWNKKISESIRPSKKKYFFMKHFSIYIYMCVYVCCEVKYISYSGSRGKNFLKTIVLQDVPWLLK